MEDDKREHLLQKVVAVSGFLFALLILPIAQFALVNGRPAEEGTVAGVSTDETVTQASIEDPTACLEDKQQKLTELQEWLSGRLIALDRSYTAVVAPYQAALPVVTGDVEAEQRALNELIAKETAKYDAEKAQIVAAVDAQVKEQSSRDCGVATTQE
jgi:peptidoglycan hydrolase CwlO-like protein